MEGIKTDSRKVKKGDLFIAYKGVNVDGHDYIEDAIKNGATTIVGEKPRGKVKVLLKYPNVEYIQVSDGRKFWAEAMAQKYDYPQKKLKIIGVTGTDGKTTTVNFIYQILKTAGKKVGMINSISAKYADKELPTGFHVTTPDPDELFRFLKQMVDKGIEYVVLEVTSHALAQHRVHGIRFTCSGITNVTPEHLNLHGTYENLLQDKALIYNHSDTLFLNQDGLGIDKILDFFPSANSSSISYVSKPNVKWDVISDVFFERFPGEYNRENLSLAFGICRNLGIPEANCYKAFNNMNSVKGRFQKVANKKGINIIVDFAHTENAIKCVLGAVHNIKSTNQRVITVFGCASERDKFKRPKMGKVAADLSHVVIVTSEDTRGEDPMEIARQAVSGAPDFDFIINLDRAEAIKEGIGFAKRGDWVLILGKGHEESMNYGFGEVPWSDVEVVRQFL